MNTTEIRQVVSALVERVKSCETEIEKLKKCVTNVQTPVAKNILFQDDKEFRPKRPEDFLPVGDFATNKHTENL